MTFKTTLDVVGLRLPVALIVLCFAWSTSGALAQPKPEETQAEKTDPPKSEPKAEPKEAEPKTPEVQPKPAPKTKPASKGHQHKGAHDARGKTGSSTKASPGCGASKKRRGKLSMEPDPNAAWECEAPTVTLEPVWQGKSMVFEFNIRNTGTADLHIRAKGG
ncbi:MAG: hypothetical protein GY842_22965 [bacterium]|nr:hypothetical protein [bacterium]